MNTSILSDLKQDFCWLYLPSLFALFIALLLNPYNIPTEGIAMGALLFLVFYCLDAGHTFITGLRVFRIWNRESTIYALLLVCIFFISLLCAFVKPIWLFRTYLYATVFHHMRQNWGLTAWYQKLNGHFVSHTRIVTQVLLLLPLLAYHFNPESHSAGFFDEGELLLYPSQILYVVTAFVFIVLLAYALVREVRMARTGPIEWNRIMSMVCPITVQSLVYFFCKKSIFPLVPMIIGHSFTYAILMGMSLQKLSPTRNLRTIAFWIGILLLAGGSTVYLADTIFETGDFSTSPLLHNSLLALITLPALWHYVVDAFIWKGKHPEAAFIYAK